MDMEKILVGVDCHGTLIRDNGRFPGSLWPKTDDLSILPGVVEGIKLLRAIPDSDVKVVMISNQSGPARGKVRLENIPHINEYINGLLKKQGAGLDGMYFCEHVPHSYVSDLMRRKPGEFVDKRYVQECQDWKPWFGMFTRAVADLWEASLPGCGRLYMIGDRADPDLQTALTINRTAQERKCVGVFVQSDVKEHSFLHEAEALQKEHPDCVYIARDFLHAAELVKQDILKSRNKQA